MPVIINSPAFSPSVPVNRSVQAYSTVTEEGSTGTYVFTLQTAGGGSIPNTDLLTAKITLFDEETRAVINSRQNQDILGAPTKTGANNVTISGTSTFTWTWLAADSAVVDPTRTKTLEWHRAVFDATMTVGLVTERVVHEIRFPVRRQFAAVQIS